MTIITFLGLIGGNYNDKSKQVSLWSGYEGAKYSAEEALEEEWGLDSKINGHKYANMLPILLDCFPDEEVVAVGTEASANVQRELFASLGRKDFPSGENLVILESEKKYDAIFTTLNHLLGTYDELIVDISHSFRHLPILMVVNMLIENLEDPQKIKNIFFAKEIKKDKNYEIVDLQRYLELADISYALASFTDNYTVANTILPKNKDYRALLSMLRKFSEHLLANSFETLFGTHQKNDSPLVQKIINSLEVAKHYPVTKPIRRYLNRINNHMMELKELSREPLDEQYYAIAKMLFYKGYLLNTVVLIDEALGRYCLEGIRKFDPSIAKDIQKFEKIVAKQNKYSTLYNRYVLGNQAKGIIKFGKFYNGIFLDNESLKKRVLPHLSKLKKKQFLSLQNFLFSCDALRNDLAHANSDKAYENIKVEIERHLQKYQDICTKNDPLNRFN